jgi:hypothetical protein
MLVQIEVVTLINKRGCMHEMGCRKPNHVLDASFAHLPLPARQITIYNDQPLLKPSGNVDQTVKMRHSSPQSKAEPLIDKDDWAFRLVQ